MVRHGSYPLIWANDKIAVHDVAESRFAIHKTMGSVNVKF